MNKTGLPQKIFVYEEQDGEDTYLSARYDKKDTADNDGPRLVGTYYLNGTEEVSLVVKSKKVGK